MPIDKDIQSLVRREYAAQKKGLTADALFQSHEFIEHLENLVRTLTRKIGVAIKLNPYFDDSGDTAGTNGKTIYQNLHNPLVYAYDSILSKYMAQVGTTFHEVGHILYLDFNAHERAINALKAGLLPAPEPDNLDEEAQTALEELKEALPKPGYNELLVNAYQQLANCVADPHDEDKLIEDNGGFVERAIVCVRESLLMSTPSVEDMMKRKDMTPLSILYAEVLQYVRFGEVVTDDPDHLWDLEPMQKLAQMSQALDLARYTDDPIERATQLTRMLVFLWPYIKDAIDEQEQQDQSQQSGDPSASGQGSSPQSQQGGGSQSQQGGSSQPQSGGQKKQPSQQSIQKVADQLAKGAQNAGQTAAPVNGKSSKQAITNSKAAKQGQQKDKGAAPTPSGDQLDAGESAMQNALDGLMDQIAKAKAEEQITRDITSQMNVEIHAVNQAETHKGKSVRIVAQTKVDQSDIQLYDSMMQELSGYSRRLIKRMQEALRDLKTGSIAHHRAIGSKFEANAAYRPDQKYFAKKKLPQDLPDMAISILVDHSGSMAGPRLNAAMRASMLLYDFATKLDIPVEVSGHNTSDSGINYYTYTSFRQVRADEKYRLATMGCGSSNRDGMAIEIAANRLAKRPEDIKLLFIISDGQPNDWGYGGDEAAADIANIVKRYRKQGVESIAAAIGTDKDRIKAIYGEGAFLDIENLDSMPKILVRMVQKRIVNQ